MNLNFGLATKIGIVAIVLIAITAGAVSITNLTGTTDILIRGALGDLEGDVNSHGQTLVAGIEVLEQDVLFLSNTPPVQGIIRTQQAEDGIDPQDGSTEEIWRERLDVIFTEMLEAKPQYFQARYIGVADDGLELVRVQRTGNTVEVVSESGLTPKGDSGYFLGTLPLAIGETYLSAINLNREGGVVAEPRTVTLRASTPVYGPDGELFGMVVINEDFGTVINETVEVLHENETVYITNSDGDFLLWSGEPDKAFGFDLGERHTMQDHFPDLAPLFQPGNILLERPASPEIRDDIPALHFLKVAGFDAANPDRFLGVAVSTPYAEITGEVQQVVSSSVISTIALVALGAVAAFAAARFLLNPLARVTSTVTAITGGDLSQRVQVASQDEIGVLGNAFNQMADQVQDLVGSLEGRVAERTRDLQTVADVNAQISTILEVDRLLQDVADLTKERFGLYHAHIYTTNEARDTLVLTAGAGHVGRQMVGEYRTIDWNNRDSIVASSARDRKGVIINDVTLSETFLPHPALPDTRSEMAVPLIARGQVLGVLDVQSDAVDNFDEETLSLMELMAGQVATALSNAQLFSVAERSSRHEAALGAIDQKIQSALDMDDLLKTAVRELGKALRVPHTAIELQMATETSPETKETSTNGSTNGSVDS